VNVIKEDWMQETMLRNRRRHKRGAVLRAVEYSVISSSNKNSCHGIISDISTLGMCLLTTTPLKLGEKIALKVGDPASRTAVVLWSGVGAFYYKAGLKFV
jgi:hypothetical protein